LENTLDITVALEQCKDIFSSTAIECANTLFGLNCTIKDKWTIVDRMPGKFSHSISMGNGNDRYQGIMAIGLSSEDMQKIIALTGVTEILDMFGEILNSYCGLLMDHYGLTEKFGILIQSLPQYTSEEVHFPKAWACVGQITSEQGISMAWGFAIRSYHYIL
jgi:hypothetical protein